MKLVGWMDAEQPATVGQRLIQKLLRSNLAQRGESIGNMTEQSRVISLAAEGNRGHIGRIGLDQQLVRRDGRSGLQNLAGVLKGCHSAKPI